MGWLTIRSFKTALVKNGKEMCVPDFKMGTNAESQPLHSDKGRQENRQNLLYSQRVAVQKTNQGKS